MSSKSRFEGYLLTDHRATQLPGYSGMQETATISCVHCGTVYAKRPEFDGSRCYCKKCDRYVCNHCARAMTHPDYIHRSFAEIADLVRSGKAKVNGSLSSETPIILLS